jgi:hypothetical protein
MKYAVEMGSGAMIYSNIPSFINKDVFRHSNVDGGGGGGN